MLIGREVKTRALLSYKTETGREHKKKKKGKKIGGVKNSKP
jgi:hypothetical protein